MVTNVICSFTIGDQSDIKDCIRNFMNLVDGSFNVSDLDSNGHYEVYYEASRLFCDRSRPGRCLPVYISAEKISDNPTTIKYRLRPEFGNTSKDFTYTEVFNADNG